MKKIKILALSIATSFLNFSIAFGKAKSPAVIDIPCTLANKKLCNLGEIIGIVVNTAMGLLGAIAIIMLVVGGIKYTTSGGEAKAVEGARDTILYAVIGIVVAVGGFAIKDYVFDSLGL